MSPIKYFYIIIILDELLKSQLEMAKYKVQDQGVANPEE